MLTKVISGGQYGADIAGLRAAKRAGIATGGAMPKGFRTRKGPRPGYTAQFGMVELAESDYPARTRKNAQDADVTVIIGYDTGSPGIRTTLRAIQEFHKKSTTITLPEDFTYPNSADSATIVDDLVAWLVRHQPAVVNIAGNRDSRLEVPVEALLFAVFTRLNAASNDAG